MTDKKGPADLARPEVAGGVGAGMEMDQATLRGELRLITFIISVVVKAFSTFWPGFIFVPRSVAHPPSASISSRVCWPSVLTKDFTS